MRGICSASCSRLLLILSRMTADIIFARGFVEGVSYVKMAKEMPRLSGQEIEAEWQRLGLSDEARPASVAGSTTGAV